MPILIDGIATVWLQKRGLPTKGKSSPLEYKEKVESYLLANPKDWPYYNRKGYLDPFGGAELPKPPAVELAATSKHLDEEPAHVVIQQRPEVADLLPPPPSPPPTTTSGGKKIYYVVVRQPQRLVREFLKTYAYRDQKEEEKWSDDPTWADRFLVADGAAIVAKRILGHENFKVEPL